MRFRRVSYYRCLLSRYEDHRPNEVPSKRRTLNVVSLRGRRYGRDDVVADLALADHPDERGAERSAARGAYGKLAVLLALRDGDGRGGYACWQSIQADRHIAVEAVGALDVQVQLG